DPADRRGRGRRAGDPGGVNGDELVASLRPELAALDGVSVAADAHVAQRGADDRARYAVGVVLEELLTNAVKYASARADLEVRVAVREGAIVVRISDDGCPFDPTTAGVRAAPTSLAT